MTSPTADDKRLAEIKGRTGTSAPGTIGLGATDAAAVLRLLDTSQARLAKAEQDRDTFEACDRERAEKLIDCQARLAEVERALGKIDAIRNSIVGMQRINWSAHIYPLVAALGEAGYEGEGYDEARAKACTLVDALNGTEERTSALAAALRTIMAVVGTSTEAHKIAREALASAFPNPATSESPPAKPPS